MPWSSVSRGLALVERALLPQACLLCGVVNGPGDGDDMVCRICQSRWRRVPDPVCGRCGEARDRDDPACRICARWPQALARVRSAVWLVEGARRAVHLFKFEGWWRLADSLARPMVALEPLTDRLLLIPVPLGPRRRRRRGYNQSERLARALGRLSGLPVADRLVRIRDTRSQSSLAPEARQANVRGVFRAAGVRGRRVVLVDDVFTTGATLVAAAEAARIAGAERVEAVTFARAAGPLGPRGIR